MPLEVVDSHDGEILGRRQTLGVCIAHQKRGDEAGMAGHGNAVKPVNANPGFTEGGLDDRVDVLQVLAGRKLGYDAAVCRMSLIWLLMTLDRTSCPSLTTAAAVSSQLLSIPRMFIFLCVCSAGESA